MRTYGGVGETQRPAAAARMIIPKKNRKAIYEDLFKEGVLVAHKDFFAPKHQTLDVPNLQVIKAMQSLKSRGYVTERFNWQWYYYYLTTEGIEYLREYLHLPAEIVPATLKKKVQAAPPGRILGREDRPRRDDGDRDSYRPRRAFGDADGEKKAAAGAGGEFKPQFRGAFGRGRGGFGGDRPGPGGEQ
jgi:small subunit ribosomal protein S10e